MIRINLLGKKKVAAVPFGIDEKLERLGVNMAEIQELRPGLIRLAVIVAGVYAANYVPAYFHEEKIKALDAEVQKFTGKGVELQKELATKKDIRKQMEQLKKDEDELNRQLNAVNALQQSRGLAFNTLNDVTVQMSKVDKVWIDDIKFENHRVTVNGHAWEYFAINDFVKLISDSTRYANVQFRDIASEPAEGKIIPGIPESAQKMKKFSMDFSVKDGE